MGRIILLLIIGFLIYLLFRGFLKSQLKKPDETKAVEAEDMVRCQRCGVNLPRSDSTTLDDGRVVCRENPACQ